MFYYYNILISAILTVLFLIMLWNLYILRRKDSGSENDSLLPFVSVLIPARNEELNIEGILETVLEQDYPNYEVIVLNDNSEDNTGEILERLSAIHPKLKVINGKTLIKGWTGKCFACKQLYEASKGEYIIFTDADTRHYNSSIRKNIQHAIERDADMLTTFPLFIMKTLSEKIIMPMLMFTAMLLLPMYFVDKKGYHKFSIGIGPFMLFKRSAYEKIGGHESVKNALVEDVWLARVIKQKGLKLVAADGLDLLNVRMYRNFGEIWDGFSKNIFAGFEFSSITLFAVNLMYVLLFLLPFVLLVIELFLSFGSKANLYLLIYQVVLLYLARFLLAFRFQLGYLSAVLHPLGALSVPVIALNSWRWITFGVGAKWKGRIYNPADQK